MVKICPRCKKEFTPKNNRPRYCSKHCQQNPYTRKWWYEKKYNITLEQFEQMKTSQNNCCAICNNPLKDGRGSNVDHDHTTGKVRGVLCHKCNTAIGLLGDNISIVCNVRDYLIKWKWHGN